MAELINDDELRAPLILAENLQVLLGVVQKVIDKGKEYNGVSKSNSGGELKKKTTDLTASQKELLKVQDQISTLSGRNSNAYRHQEKQLQNLRKELKEKSILGKKDSKESNAQNSSISQLSAALKKNQAEYASLRTEKIRSSKAGRELLATIQAQDKELKKLFADIKKSTIGELADSMKDLKVQYKSALDEMVRVGNVFGETSEEFKEAALKAGDLKDKIGDLNEATKAVSGEPLERMGGSFDLILGKLRALDFKGAQQGVNQFTAASKALTFKEATKGLGGFTKALVQMGRAILTNPLFLLVALIIGIVVAVVKLKDKIKPLKLAFDLVGDAIDAVVQLGKDFLDWIGLTTFALDEAADALIEAKKKEMEAIEKRYDWEIKLAGAAGKETFDQEKAKQNAIISSAAIIVSALNGKVQRLTELNEEEKQLLEEMVEKQKDAANELKLIAILEAKFKEEQRKKELAEELAFREEIAKMAVDAANARVTENDQALDKEIASYQQFITQRLKDQSLSEAQRAKIIRDADKHIVDLRKAAAIDSLTTEIAALEEALIAISFSAEEEKKIKQTLHDLKMKLINDEFEGLQRNQKTQLEKDQEMLEKSLQIYEMFASSVGNLMASLSEGRLQQLDKEQKQLESNYERELKLAGDNEEEKAKIKNKFDRQAKAIEARKITEQRRMANFDKYTSAAQAAIATSLAVAKSLPNIPLSIAVGAAGAIQVAAILAKPLPAYEKGTGPGGHIGGPALVGEKGSELMIDPQGNLSLTPARPTVMDLPKGTEVIPHEDTMRMLALSSLRNTDTTPRKSESSELLKDIGKKLQDVEKTIRNKREAQFNITRQGAQKLIKTAETRSYFINQFFK
jgi:hypothetical protein